MKKIDPKWEIVREKSCDLKWFRHFRKRKLEENWEKERIKKHISIFGERIKKHVYCLKYFENPNLHLSEDNPLASSHTHIQEKSKMVWEDLHSQADLPVRNSCKMEKPEVWRLENKKVLPFEPKCKTSKRHRKFEHPMEYWMAKLCYKTL